LLFLPAISEPSDPTLVKPWESWAKGVGEESASKSVELFFEARCAGCTMGHCPLLAQPDASRSQPGRPL